MNSNKIKRKQFIKDGYFVGKINLKVVKELRTQLLSIFNTVSKHSNGIKIKNDSDLIKLYNSNKRFVWETAYELRLFEPLLYKLAVRKEIFNFAKIAGIKKPHFKVAPNLRFDMPHNYKISKSPYHPFKVHQDHPFTKGSKNSVVIWIPLQDAVVENGALKIVEGSHKGRKVYKTDKYGIIKSKYKFVFKDAPFKLGEVLIFDQCLVHKSGYNSSNSVRFSIQLRVHDLSEKDSVSQLLLGAFCYSVQLTTHFETGGGINFYNFFLFNNRISSDM